MEVRYEVIYIDKFTDMAEAEIARKQLQRRFHMNDQVLTTLCCGKPIVIKKNVSMGEAERFMQAVKESGCECWIQKMTPDGVHHERRLTNRRFMRDRRADRRGCAIVPDRRQSRGRRTSDKRH